MTLTADMRAQRRAADRQLMIDAVQALSTSEGWLRWVHTRRAFHHYSLHNQLLIALQRPDATHVASFRTWLRLGYCVRKGERALRIWAPVPPSKARLAAWRDAGSSPKDKPRMTFRLVAVFDRAQVDELPDHPGGPAPLEPPHHLVDGDDLAHLLADHGSIAGLCDELGVCLRFGALPAGAHGCYEHDRRRITLAGSLPANHQVKTAIHELAHALVRLDHQDGDPLLDYAAEELVVETVAYTVTGALGIDTGPYSVAYVASWAQRAPLETIQQTAALIDRLARRIETALLDGRAEAEEGARITTAAPREDMATTAPHR
jgi:antirestriction protein ArdC